MGKARTSKDKSPRDPAAAKITIREMTPRDYLHAFTLWSRSEGMGLSGADSRVAIVAYLRRNPGLSLVACRGPEVVATVLCGHDGRRGFLHHLAVARPYRGQGLGARLVATCLTKLAAAGIDKCHIFLHADNKNGRRFWSRMGWKEREDLVVMSSDTRTQS
jgi:N-acetylglutamate synthase